MIRSIKMSTKVIVDLNDARKVLNKAYNKALSNPKLQCQHKSFIDYVLDNTHKTYKYVLVNALLAKATNETINPLCLQKQSTLSGAYDARTICHQVLVPFEKTDLGKALGGSNEPFLNKPARFPELKKTNAVRAGNDKEILKSLCDNLPKIKDSNDAFDCLVYSLIKLEKIKKEKAALTEFSLSSKSLDYSSAQLVHFLDKLLDENYEGEILTLVVAGLFEQFMKGQSDYSVEVHPVNESGASSKEVSDLDIYLNGKLYISNELKDKSFTDHDLTHAADKVINAGKMQMNFIVGRHGDCSKDVVRRITLEYLKKGFVINIISVDTFIFTILTLIEEINIEAYLKYILEIARDTKFKETTIDFILRCAKDEFDFDN